jgi:hypothetical protein
MTAILFALTMAMTQTASAAKSRWVFCAGLDHGCAIAGVQWQKSYGWASARIGLGLIGVSLQGNVYLAGPEKNWRPYVHAGVTGVMLGGALEGGGLGFDWRLPNKRLVLGLQVSAAVISGYSGERRWEDVGPYASSYITWSYD